MEFFLHEPLLLLVLDICNKSGFLRKKMKDMDDMIFLYKKIFIE